MERAGRFPVVRYDVFREVLHVDSARWLICPAFMDSSCGRGQVAAAHLRTPKRTHRHDGRGHHRLGNARHARWPHRCRRRGRRRAPGRHRHRRERLDPLSRIHRRAFERWNPRRPERIRERGFRSSRAWRADPGTSRRDARFLALPAGRQGPESFSRGRCCRRGHRSDGRHPQRSKRGDGARRWAHRRAPAPRELVSAHSLRAVFPASAAITPERSWVCSLR